jgi:hypothetical protein
MDRKQELIQREDERWHELHGLVHRLSDEQIGFPELNPDGWSVKDMLWHLGCWAAEAANALEQIRMGTFEDPERDTDELNAGFLEMGRQMDLDTVKTEMTSARTRALQEWGSLPQVTPQAEEWFYESGAEHYDDHLPELRSLVEKLT